MAANYVPQSITGAAGFLGSITGAAVSIAMTQPTFNSFVVACAEIPDDEFRAAFEKFVAAEGDVGPTCTSEELFERIREMRRALRELSRAAEQYLFRVED